MTRETRHHDYTVRRLSLETTDSLGMNLGELREFVRRCDAADVPDDVLPHAGGFTEQRDEYEKWFFFKRLEVRFP